MDINHTKQGTHTRQPWLSLLLCIMVLLIFTSSTSVFEYFENVCIETIECPESGEKTEFDKENKLDDYIQAKFENTHLCSSNLTLGYSFLVNSRQIFSEISTPPPERVS